MQEVDCENCQIVKILLEKIKQLEERIIELERRLSQYENPHTPPSRLNRKYPPKTKSYGKPGRRKGHKGITRSQSKPSEHIEAKIKSCPNCGKPLGKPVKIERKIIEEIPEPMPVKVIEYISNHYHCKNCNRKFTASNPDVPKKGRFGKNVLAQTTLMKYEERLPHRKIQTALERQYGLKVSAGTIFDFTNRVHKSLQSEYNLILQVVRCSKTVYSDETSIKVNGKRYWIWIFVTPSNTFVVIRKSRGKKVLKEVLTNKYKGTIVCDGWKPYTNFTSRIQRCWAHILRELKYLAGKIDDAIHLNNAIHRLYNKMIKIIGEDPPPSIRKKLWYQSRATMKRWLNRKYEDPLLKKLVEKIKNGFDHWFTFIINPGVEPTNNRAERALREFVVQRKIIGTLRNEKGTHIYEVIMSVLATWKQQGKNLQNSLRNLL